MRYVLRRSLTIVIAASLVTGALLAGCTGGDNGTQPPPEPEPAPAPAPGEGNGNGGDDITGPAMYISPERQTVSVGDTFQVELMVTGIDEQVMSRGAQWTLEFTPDILECEGFTAGDFYDDFETIKAGFEDPDIDNDSGLFPLTGIAIYGDRKGGPGGSGLLGTYDFKALAAGEATIELGIGELATGDRQKMEIEHIGATVVVD